MKKYIKIVVLLVVCFLFLGVVRADEKHCVCNDSERDIPHDQTCTQDSDCYNACSIYNGPYRCEATGDSDTTNGGDNTDSDGSNDTQDEDSNISHCYCKDNGVFVEMESISCNIGDDAFCARQCLDLSMSYVEGRCGSSSGGNGGRSGDRNGEPTIDPADFDIPTTPLACKDIVGTNLLKLIKAGITIFQVACVVFALVKGMMILIPPIISKDMDALSKSARDLVLFAIILLAALLFKPIVSFIGKLTDFDVSCITWIFKGYF